MFKFIFTLLLPAAPVSAHAAPDATGHVATGSRASIYFERYGNGPNLVLIPGRLFLPEFASLAGPDERWSSMTCAIAAFRRRVEDVAQITIMRDVDDLEAMRLHFGGKKVSLVGYSYLGLMVALYAAQHSDQVERLVQIGPVPRKFGTSYPSDQEAGSDSLSAEGKAAETAWNALRANLEKPDFKIDPKAACAVFQLYSSYRLVGNPANHSKVADTCQYENEMLGALNRHFPALFGDLQGRDLKRRILHGAEAAGTDTSRDN